MRTSLAGVIPALAALIGLAACAGDVASEPALVQDARVVWTENVEGFGGFSGIEVTDGGNSAVVVSDRGHWATVDLVRSDGRLVEVETSGFGPLLAISGAPLDGEDVDAEGLAVDEAGRAYVSFEAFHRIRRYDEIDASAVDIPAHPDFADLQNNSGLEALAVDDAGRIYAIPERSGAWERPFPLYVWDGKRWSVGAKIPRRGKFLVVGADVGPDGRLYLLERDFRWAGGFANRIRRFDLESGEVRNEQTLLETAFGSLDNYEGISVWKDALGTIRATLVADDNFVAIQQTVISEYMLLGE